MAEEVIVAGAGFAGLNAALELADRGYEVEIIDSKGTHDYVPSAIDVISGRREEEDLRLDLSDFLSGTSIDFKREKILRVDPKRSVVETNSGAHSYENLVLALGYDVSAYGMDISDLEGAYTVEGAAEISEKVGDAEDALVLGCGYVGLEAAGALEEAEIDVTMIDQVTRPMPNSGQTMSEKALDILNEKDIAFKGGRTVEDVDSRQIVFEDGERLSADLVVWSVGMEASHVVQRSFGCGPEGLPVNQGLNSKEYGEVFAAGSCADLDVKDTAQNAIREGRVIAENIAKDRRESLKRFEKGKDSLIVTIGDEAVLEHGDKAYRNRFFRFLKRLIETRYWLKLKWKKFRLHF